MMGLVTIDEFVSQSFDYIVAGGGTAGLVVAARLSENPQIRVGVIEAGSARLDDQMILTAGLSGALRGNPDYDWAFVTTPQKYSNNKVVKHPRGRVLGGTSAINFSMWSQSTRRDLDNWEKLGNQGWSWDDLMHYYCRAETFHPPTDAARNFYPAETAYLNPSLRGTDGPIQIGLPDKDDFVSMAWTRSCRNAHLNQGKPLADPRTGSSLGGFNQLKAVDPQTGERSYSANAYFAPNANRPNLLVLTDALAARIVLEKRADDADDLSCATGVELMMSVGENTTTHFVRAMQEVIISCGTIQSPHILELSGIGAPDLLQQMGIEVKVASTNVGENLQDHVICMMPYELRDPELAKQHSPSFMTTANLSLKDIMMTADEPLDLNMKGGEEDESRLLLECDYKLQRESLSDPDQAVVSLIGHAYTLAQPPMFIMTSSLTNPFSRGSIHVASSDPGRPPVIDPRYYSHPLDLEIMSHTLLRSHDVVIAEPLCRYIKDNDHRKKARDAMKNEAKERVATHFHPVGTCAMKPRENGGVVNDRLVVYGTRNVRVVDASICPMHVQGNPMSLVYAIAEKAADLIKEDHS